MRDLRCCNARRDTRERTRKCPARLPDEEARYAHHYGAGRRAAETAEVRDDHLFIGGVDMVELARKEGTALYVFDEADLRHRMEAYREAFRSRYENSDIIYASKAFLNKEVARIAEAEGLCLDVSGGGEWPALAR